MSTHYICFHEEIRKNSVLLDWKKKAFYQELCLNFKYGKELRSQYLAPDKRSIQIDSFSTKAQVVATH